MFTNYRQMNVLIFFKINLKKNTFRQFVPEGITITPLAMLMVFYSY